MRLAFNFNALSIHSPSARLTFRRVIDMETNRESLQATGGHERQYSCHFSVLLVEGLRHFSVSLTEGLAAAVISTSVSISSLYMLDTEGAVLWVPLLAVWCLRVVGRVL